MKGLKWGLKGTLRCIVWNGKLINALERLTDKQTDNIMAGALRQVQDLAPKTNNAGALKKRTRIHVAEVGSILRPF